MVIHPNCRNITTDNDSLFTSQIVNSLFESYQVAHHKTPIGHSTTNGQVERAHSTILELARALAEQQNEGIEEVVYRAVREYNNTIHSVTKQKPSELFLHSDKYPEMGALLQKALDQMLLTHNKKRVRKTFEPGDIIYIKTDRRKKSVPRYSKHIVKTDNKETVTTTKNKIFHKDRIRNT